MLKEMDDPYKENNRYVPNNGRSPSSKAVALLGGQIPLWNVPSEYPCKIFSRSLCHYAQCIIGLGIVNTGPASSKKARSVCVVWLRNTPTTNLPTIVGLGSDLFVL
jgi:hypothetical protein